MDERENNRSLFAEALAVGLVGAATVAIWFFVIDLIRGDPFLTPGILGSAVFLGISSPHQAVINFSTVGLYTLLHGAIFFLVGVGVTALVRAADRRPSFLGLIIPLAAVLEVLFVGGVAMVAQFLLGAVAWWAVLGGNLLASLLMGSLLLHWHPSVTEEETAAEAFSPS